MLFLLEICPAVGGVWAQDYGNKVLTTLNKIMIPVVSADQRHTCL